MYEEYLFEYFLFLREKLESSIYKTGYQLNRAQKEDLRSYLGEKYVDIVRRINQGKTKPDNPQQYVLRALDKSVFEYIVKDVLNNRNRRYKLLSSEDMDRLPDEKTEIETPFYKLEILRHLNKLEKKVVSLKANGYTHTEIAFLLEITVHTSKHTYRSAKAKLLRHKDEILGYGCWDRRTDRTKYKI
jgi:DNA-directed RNA polymerase specialized sigma24 family protein